MKNNIFFLSLCFALCLILMGCASEDIFAQLHFELLNCKRPYRLHDMTGMPAESCGNVISLDACRMRDAA